jgi:hypothetical protein
VITLRTRLVDGISTRGAEVFLPAPVSHGGSVIPLDYSRLSSFMEDMGLQCSTVTDVSIPCDGHIHSSWGALLGKLQPFTLVLDYYAVTSIRLKSAASVTLSSRAPPPSYPERPIVSS